MTAEESVFKRKRSLRDSYNQSPRSWGRVHIGTNERLASGFVLYLESNPWVMFTRHLTTFCYVLSFRVKQGKKELDRLYLIFNES